MSKRVDTGSKSDQTSNHNILGITYVMAALFPRLAAYLGYFLQVKSEDVINNSYNARLDSFSDRIVRGGILASDGTVLAQTQMNGEESETGVYPFGDISDYTVGYSTKGKTGIEALANFYLLTSHVNLMEQVGDELTGNKNPGGDVYTILDTELQQATYTALGARKGVIIAMRPDIGKMLAIVSKPGYDSNSLLGDRKALTTQENREDQLLNKATQRLCPPGSTFKTVTTLEYMREHPTDYKDYQFDCDSVYESREYRVKCYHGTAYGYQDFTLAFANSCSDTFTSLGLEMDLGKWDNTAGELLFNGPLPLSGVSYKQSTYDIKSGAEAWGVLQTSIKQGTTQITPLHNVMITAATANGGTLMRPYFLDFVVSAEDETIKKFMSAAYGSLMSARKTAGLTEPMRAVVAEGTGSAVRTDTCTVTVKTGSTKFETGRGTHVQFTGFALTESPRLVVTVLVEEDGNGGEAAAPVARQLFDIYMDR